MAGKFVALSPFIKKGDRKDLGNYRPTTSLNTIYKIWTIILARRIAQMTYFLTSDIQYSYKTTRSDSDIIFYLK